ncbi:hypothetical protein OIU78_025887 [Salix suchowensis]|nr:hypothetical protein OIU78_025887 [Salix suchowensis]
MGLSKLLIFGLARIYQAPFEGIVPIMLDQLDKIFKVLGHPTLEKWPTLASLPHWHNDVEHIQGHKYENTGLHSVVPLSPKGAPFDLISKMLEYDPRKRIEAAQALEHDYFRSEPLPGRNALVPLNPGEKSHQLSYSSSEIRILILKERLAFNLHNQVSSGNAVSEAYQVLMELTTDPHLDQWLLGMRENANSGHGGL